MSRAFSFTKPSHHEGGQSSAGEKFSSPEEIRIWEASETTHKYPKPENAILIWCAYSCAAPSFIHLSATIHPSRPVVLEYLALSHTLLSATKERILTCWIEGRKGPKSRSAKCYGLSLRCHFRCLTLNIDRDVSCWRIRTRASRTTNKKKSHFSLTSEMRNELHTGRHIVRDPFGEGPRYHNFIGSTTTTWTSEPREEQKQDH